MSRKIVCDRCGKDITALPKLGFIGVSFRDPETGDLLDENPLQYMDYCPECMDQIKSYIYAKPVDMRQVEDHKPEPEPVIDPEPEAKAEPVITPEEVDELAAKLHTVDFEDGEPEPKPEPKKKQGPPNAKNVDTGKLLALRKAGWTFQQIADEMKISTATVSYHLTRLKGKNEA